MVWVAGGEGEGEGGSLCSALAPRHAAFSFSRGAGCVALSGISLWPSGHWEGLSVVAKINPQVRIFN